MRFVCWLTARILNRRAFSQSIGGAHARGGGRHPYPARAGLSREKSHIDELQLIEREFRFWLAGIDWRRLVDFRHRNSRKKALANELSEAQVQHSQGIQTPREAQ